MHDRAPTVLGRASTERSFLERHGKARYFARQDHCARLAIARAEGAHERTSVIAERKHSERVVTARAEAIRYGDVRALER
jgi:hypothetical protein